MTKFRLIYVTAKDEDEAYRLGRDLVERRLAACINLWPGMRSVYWWEGKLDESREAVLVIKTEASRVDAVLARLGEIHSYQCYCALVLPVEGGNPDYLRWLDASLAGTRAE